MIYKIINTYNRKFKNKTFKTLKGAEKYCNKINTLNNTSITKCNYFKIVMIENN